MLGQLGVVRHRRVGLSSLPDAMRPTPVCVHRAKLFPSNHSPTRALRCVVYAESDWLISQVTDDDNILSPIAQLVKL